MNNLMTAAANKMHLAATFATNTGITEVDTFKTRMVGTISTLAICFVAWKILTNLFGNKLLSLIGVVIGGGIALYFINDPTNALDFVKGLWTKFTGGTL